jgi:predicted permease
MLAALWTSVQGVLTIVIMIGLGYALQGFGWFDDRFSGSLSKIIMRVALPCSIIMSMLANFTLGRLASLWVELVIAVAGMLASYLIAVLAVRLLRVPRGRRGLMITAMCGGNTLIVQSATPCLAVLPILADEYHGDVKYATSAVTLTSVFFIVVVPVIMLLVH